MAEYIEREAALLCRYNKGFPAYRKIAMMICEMDIKVVKSRKELK